jgi:hypothetical protein
MWNFRTPAAGVTLSSSLIYEAVDAMERCLEWNWNEHQRLIESLNVAMIAVSLIASKLDCNVTQTFNRINSNPKHPLKLIRQSQHVELSLNGFGSS